LSKIVSNKGSVFQIEVTGKINTSIIDFMDDFEFCKNNKKGENTFLGWLPDQTALLGLLAGLTDLHCEIKCVRNLLK
jgi:hypothetical protein